MSSDLQKKVDEYKAGEATMPELVKTTKVKEVQDFQDRIKEFQSKAQQDVNKKEQELLSPIVTKAKKAIADVAKEKGYAYIFDAAQGTILYSEESDNVLPLVKKKLGIN